MEGLSAPFARPAQATAPTGGRQPDTPGRPVAAERRNGGSATDAAEPSLKSGDQKANWDLTV